MAYRFTGFFARPSIECPDMLPDGVVWRKISVPFLGVGVRLVSPHNDKPDTDEAKRLLMDVGLGDATDWLYLNYVMWAGHIDYLYGLGVSSGRKLGPVAEADEEATQEAYLKLMGEFGVAPADALNFPPFERGFWNE